MSTHPTVEQEIDRKAITELERIMHGLATKRIGLVAAASSLQTLWQTVSGLVDRETMELLAQSCTDVAGELKGMQIADNVALLIGAPGGDIVVRRDGASVRVQQWVGTHCSEREFVAPQDNTQPEAWASEKFADVVTNLNFRGFALAIRQ